MRLCPYPFSRMQTKNEQTSTGLGPDANQAGFFPCCPSWLNKSYWDLGFEKDLDDIWNGKAAIELRKKMYEGDYSFCNRHECKIPLLSIDEMSDPDINFLETPISPENIEAIKQKNPIMPSPPSSLHLVADLRCNLKCPTCRPEVISNTTSSKEADEEYDFVHNLKKSVEIIKMSSAGEVFYSRVQRNLIKSFNQEDFPKLKRIHIVSNGTLLSQKTYNDLLPGTSFIKDISISIDAGTKEVYEKLRGPYWEQVLENLEWLAQMRKTNQIEMLSLNFTLLKDNYRDIPQLVALAKKNNVDRILIQKYIIAPKQGFKTSTEQLDQSIHLPTHPEHIHMLRTLEMFKNEPILHTLIELEGYEDKLENNVKDRKMVAFTQKTQNFLEKDDFLGLFDYLKNNVQISHIPQEDLNRVRTCLENGTLDLTNPSPMLSCDGDNLGLSAFSINLETFIFKFQESNQHIKAINTFTLLSLLKPNHEVTILYSIAISLKGLSRYNEAEFFLTKALEQDEKNNAYLMEAAFIKKNKNELEAAYTIFSKVSTEEARKQMLDIENILYYKYLDLAFSHTKKQHSSEAMIFFQKAYEIAPFDKKEEAYYYQYSNIGDNLQQKGDYDKAIEAFSMASVHEPDNKKGEVNKKVDDLRYYLNLDMGFMFQKHGNYAKALEAFKKAESYVSDKNKNEINNYINDCHYYLSRDLGFSLQQAGQYLKATKTFEEALKYGQGDADLFFSMGISLKRQKSYPQAKIFFNKVLASRPDHFWALMELGSIEFLEGQNTEALKYYYEARKIEPTDKKDYCRKYILMVERKLAKNSKN